MAVAKKIAMFHFNAFTMSSNHHNHRQHTRVDQPKNNCEIHEFIFPYTELTSIFEALNSRS